MNCLTSRRHKVNLQIINNKASAKLKCVIADSWNINYQLIPPDVHQRNVSEHSISTFKYHCLVILTSINAALPKYLWDLLLKRAEITLNILQQATLISHISAWEYFNCPFDYNDNPVGPIIFCIIKHENTSTRISWDFRGKDSFYIGPTLRHYHTLSVIEKDTKHHQFPDTVKFWHSYIAQPSLNL